LAAHARFSVPHCAVLDGCELRASGSAFEQFNLLPYSAHQLSIKAT